jgi:hypothetical protein
MHRVIATQCALVREPAGALRQRFVDADNHQLGSERVELGHRTVMGAGGQAPCPPRRGQCRARFEVGKDTGGGRVAVPQLRCDIGAVLDDDQLDQRRGVEVQPQRRCSDTSSDTEPRAATLARRRERGRSGKRTSPRRTSSANASSRPIADSRATRLPRRVTTISTPCSTRSRCSLKRSCRARTPTSSSPRCSVIGRSLAATSQAVARGWRGPVCPLRAIGRT